MKNLKRQGGWAEEGRADHITGRDSGKRCRLTRRSSDGKLSVGVGQLVYTSFSACKILPIKLVTSNTKERYKIEDAQASRGRNQIPKFTDPA